MKVMTFNTQHCKGYLAQKIDFDLMADAILQYAPDIVGLNEMYDAGERPEFTAQVATLAALAGYPYHGFAKAIDYKGNNPYGNGFLSKLPIENFEVIPIPDPAVRSGKKWYETRCLLKAVLAGGITVLVTHFGLNNDEQQNAVDTVMQHLAAEKCILMGDFNVLPDDPVLAPIRARMKDTAEVFDAPKLSWPSDVPRQKIDYIFVSPDIDVIAADIPEIVASDHRPHTAEVLLK
ncbi:MAG: endonuclease/exonuclease/phosphatase family protein [Clostridia bacterium]|nr:endonuclease/exonuclease/phosphatase family protein [Clostridia bacterium]